MCLFGLTADVLLVLTLPSEILLGVHYAFQASESSHNWRVHATRGPTRHNSPVQIRENWSFPTRFYRIGGWAQDFQRLCFIAQPCVL